MNTLKDLDKQAEAEAQEVLATIEAHDADRAYVNLVKHLLVFVGLAKFRRMPIEMQRTMLDGLNENVRIFEVDTGKMPSA